MQTAPPGTYSGMVQCATGILKNEGPLAFYKVGNLFVGNFGGHAPFKIGSQKKCIMTVEAGAGALRL